MPINHVIADIEKVEELTERTAIFIYGSPQKISTQIQKAGINKISLPIYKFMSNTFDDDANNCDWKQNGCDLILSSPGGNLACSIGILEYLRKKFSIVNVFVPTMATSSAAIMALSGAALYVGDKAVTSDFFNYENTQNLSKEVAITKAVKNCLEKGDIIDNDQIDLFLNTWNTISRSIEHKQTFKFNTLGAACAQFDVKIEPKEIHKVDTLDPEFPQTGTAALYLDIDSQVRKLMKDNKYASMVLMSKKHNFIVL